MPIDPAAALASDIGGFTHDPLRHALYAYPWETPELAAAGPREWQRDVLTYIGSRLRDPATRHQPIRIAVASGHGIGKSALIGMICTWALDTCEDTRVVVTANTEGQLTTKTMPEVGKWRRLSITADWFKVHATSIRSTEAGHGDAWKLDAVTWSENNTEAFAGLHNQGKRIVVVYDEGSGIHDKVWEVTLGALTDEATEIIWLAFGNPTKNTGGFRECFGRHRNLWATMQVDSREVEGTNKAYLDEIVRTYGLGSDIAKVRVRGMFPSASSLQLIPADLVGAARRRPAQSLQTDPLIYGVDVARFGDDHSTLAKRCGRDARSREWKRWHGADTMKVAGDIATEAQREHPDAIMVDVGNMGAGVIDRLRQLVPDIAVYEVAFGAAGRDAEWASGVRIKAANKRAEIWTSMRAWLAGGAIPDHQGLEDDLVGVEYGYNADQAIQLEKKEHMKARGLASPDDADALACTFAEPVAPRALPAHLDAQSYGRQIEHNRYAELG